MESKNIHLEAKNNWDYRSVPILPLKKHKYSVDRTIAKIMYSKDPSSKTLAKQSNHLDMIIAKMKYSKDVEELDLGLVLRRARQLAYIEPWFQFFLPDKLKGLLFICTLGRKFWTIGAVNQLAANHFKMYHQKELRQTLENHLNSISDKEWEIPIFQKRRIVCEFRVVVMPRKPSEIVSEVPDKAVTTLSVRSNKSLLTDKTNRSIDDILASMMENAKKHGR